MVHVHILEASMQGWFNRSGQTDIRVSSRWRIGLYALSAMLAIALIGTMMMRPIVSNWVSQAVQAEFVGSDLAPDVAPTQLAKPAMDVRSVRAN